TGRDLPLTLAAVDELLAAGLPRPAALISSVGSEIYLGEEWLSDEEWASHIGQGWDDAAVRGALAGVAGLERQPPSSQRRFKASYFLPHGGAADTSPARAGAVMVEQVAATLAAAGLTARLIPS